MFSLTKIAPGERAAKSFLKNNPSFNPDHFAFNQGKMQKFLDKYEVDCSKEFIWSYVTFSEIFFGLRKELASIDLKKYNFSKLFHLCVAAAMHESIGVVAKGRDRFDASINVKDRSFVPKDISTIKLQDGNLYSPDDILSGICDNLKVIIDYLYFIENSEPVGAEPSIGIVKEFYQITNCYLVAKTDWQEALWHGENISENIEDISINNVRLLRAVGQYRRSSESIQHSLFHEDGSKSRFSDYLMNPIRKLKFRILLERQLKDFKSSNSGKKFRQIIYNKAEADVSLFEIISVYLCFSIFSKIHQENYLSGNADTELLGHFVGTPDYFITLISDLSRISRQTVEKCFKYMVYNGEHKLELWHMPIVIQGPAAILIFPIFIYGTLDRFVEKASARLGIDPSKFGPETEKDVKRRLEDAVNLSELKGAVHILSAKRVMLDDNFEEIDLCFSINNCLFVCEIKTDFFAADAISFGDHVEKIHEAVGQVNRKSEFIWSNIEEFQNKYCNDQDISEICAFIITDQNHLSGANVNGTAVIDIPSFIKFFSKDIPFRMVLSRDGISNVGKWVKAFSDKYSAHDDLKKYLLNNPYVLEISQFAKLNQLKRNQNVKFTRSYVRADLKIDPELG